MLKVNIQLRGLTLILGSLAAAISMLGVGIEPCLSVKQSRLYVALYLAPPHSARHDGVEETLCRRNTHCVK